MNLRIFALLNSAEITALAESLVCDDFRREVRGVVPRIVEKDPPLDRPKRGLFPRPPKVLHKKGRVR